MSSKSLCSEKLPSDYDSVSVIGPLSTISSFSSLADTESVCSSYYSGAYLTENFIKFFWKEFCNTLLEELLKKKNIAIDYFGVFYYFRNQLSFRFNKRWFKEFPFYEKVSSRDRLQEIEKFNYHTLLEKIQRNNKTNNDVAISLSIYDLKLCLKEISKQTMRRIKLMKSKYVNVVFYKICKFQFEKFDYKIAWVGHEVFTGEKKHCEIPFNYNRLAARGAPNNFLKFNIISYDKYMGKGDLMKRRNKAKEVVNENLYLSKYRKEIEKEGKSPIAPVKIIKNQKSSASSNSRVDEIRKENLKKMREFIVQKQRTEYERLQYRKEKEIKEMNEANNMITNKKKQYLQSYIEGKENYKRELHYQIKEKKWKIEEEKLKDELIQQHVQPSKYSVLNIGYNELSILKERKKKNENRKKEYNHFLRNLTNRRIHPRRKFIDEKYKTLKQNGSSFSNKGFNIKDWKFVKKVDI